MVEFRLLGPVEVAVSGRVVELGPPQRRSVLAALAVDAGRPVPVEVLLDRVWGPESPEGARRTLQSHLTRIRRVLERDVAGGEASARLVRRGGEYLLDVDPDRVDLHRFRHLAERARGLDRTDAERVATLREALALWRGAPLRGLPGQWAARVREGWERQRLDVVVAWARAELRVGNPDPVVTQVAELVGEYPLAEPLVATLMRALHTAGRTAEALDCYVGTRTRLVEELGTEPGAELRALHQAILRDDLDQAPRAPGPAPERVRAMPAQLPLDVRGFTGRGGELARLDAILAAAGEQPTAVVISAVSGTAGVGKTALAVHWAHRVRDRFPDGQLYVNLRGFDPSGVTMAPAEAVRGFLDALEVPTERIPAQLDAQAALYRSLLAGKRMLVVLDNARDVGQARPLLPGSPGCLVLVTSRDQLSPLVGTEGAHPVTLDLLHADEARALLVGRLGPERVAGHPRAVDEIIDSCARLPLALSVVAARAATYPDFGLDVLAGELRELRGGLDAFIDGNTATDVRAVFSWSYRTLGAAAARLFRLLGLHPGPDVATAAAASLAGVPVREVRLLLAELAHAHLVTEHSPGRYGFHDLLRAYATELAHAQDSGADRREAVRRVLDHYLHTAGTANRLIDPHRDMLTLAPPRPGVTAEELRDADQAMAWFSTEHQVLLAAIRQAGDTGFDTHTWQLTWTLVVFFHRRGHWHDWLATQRAALAAAERLGDQPALAYTHRGLGRASARLERYADAVTHLTAALDLFGRLGDLTGQANAHLDLGGVSDQQGRHREALGHAERALRLFQAADHPTGQARALNAVGWCHTLFGEHRQAIDCCRRALGLHEKSADRHGEAVTLDSLGYAYHHLGDHEQAVACFQQALDRHRAIGDRYYEADTLTHLGDTYQAGGDLDAAQRAWQQALAILDELGHHAAGQVRAKISALLAGRPGRAGRAASTARSVDA